MRPGFVGAQPLEELPTELPEEAFRTPSPELKSAVGTYTFPGKSRADLAAHKNKKALPPLDARVTDLIIAKCCSPNAKRSVLDKYSETLVARGGDYAANSIHAILRDQEKSGKLSRNSKRVLSNTLVQLSMQSVESLAADRDGKTLERLLAISRGTSSYRHTRACSLRRY